MLLILLRERKSVWYGVLLRGWVFVLSRVSINEWMGKACALTMKGNKEWLLSNSWLKKLHLSAESQ